MPAAPGPGQTWPGAGGAGLRGRPPEEQPLHVGGGGGGPGAQLLPGPACLPGWGGQAGLPQGATPGIAAWSLGYWWYQILNCKD